MLIRVWGPFYVGLFSGSGWSSFGAGAITDADDEKARRETALRLSFKSDHLLEASGKEDPNRAFIAPGGQVLHDLVAPGLDGEEHRITGEQRWTRKARAEARRKARLDAEVAATAATATDDSSPAAA